MSSSKAAAAKAEGDKKDAEFDFESVIMMMVTMIITIAMMITTMMP